VKSVDAKKRRFGKGLESSSEPSDTASQKIRKVRCRFASKDEKRKKMEGTSLTRGEEEGKKD